jgi:predicted nucleic acid-binding protein
MAAAKANGQQVSTIDGLIAASAVVHDLQLVTRNTKDFAKLGVRLFNPWASANPDDVTA